MNFGKCKDSLERVEYAILNTLVQFNFIEALDRLHRALYEYISLQPAFIYIYIYISG